MSERRICENCGGDCGNDMPCRVCGSFHRCEDPHIED